MMLLTATNQPLEHTTKVTNLISLLNNHTTTAIVPIVMANRHQQLVLSITGPMMEAGDKHVTGTILMLQ